MFTFGSTLRLKVVFFLVVGLPASSIALGDDRIYWSSSDLPGVFYIDRPLSPSAPVSVLSETAQATNLASPSPGQQLIAGELPQKYIK